jgi:hypothetical protein
MKQPQLYRHDRGPHRERRWSYVVADCEKTTENWPTSRQAWAAWNRGETKDMWGDIADTADGGK